MNNNMSKSQAGFTLTELIVAVVIVGILIAIVLQHISVLNNEIETTKCIANQYKLENAALKLYSQKAVLGVPAFPQNLMELKSEFKEGKLPECPASGTYTYSSGYGTVSCDHSNHNRDSE